MAIHRIWHALSLKQRTIIFLLLCTILCGFVGVCANNPAWIFSLLGGTLSYMTLMFVTIRSIQAKILQKIQEADTEQKLQKYASKYDILLDDAQSDFAQQDRDNKESLKQTAKDKGKERLKFMDLSKASLGFELSFSLPRILVFLGMIACFVVLVWYQVFYPLVYLFGVFLGVVFVVCVLLLRNWLHECAA